MLRAKGDSFGCVWRKRSSPAFCAPLLAACLLVLLLRARTESTEPPAGPASPETVPTWDVSSGKGDAVAWQAEIGPKANAGSLAVAGDRLLVGTSTPHRSERDQGVLLCLDARTGTEVWRVAHDRLPRRDNDFPTAPIASTPAIDGDRVYYVSNRGELCCVGLADGRRVWAIDMPAELGVFKRDVSDAGFLAPSPVVDGDAVYCVTGNGGTFDGRGGWRVPSPDAPSFVSVDKRTGRVLWSSNAPGEDILYGQWSTPAVATIGGVRQVLFPGGDGLLYGFDAARGGEPLWSVDCGGDPATPHERKGFIVAPPLVVGETAYVSPNRDFEQSVEPRPILAVDLRAQAIRWSFSDKRFNGTFGPMASSAGLIYATGHSGLLVAIDAASGKAAWRREVGYGIRGGVCVHEDRIYVVAALKVHVFAARDGAPLGRFKLARSGGPPDDKAVVGDGKLYVTTRGHVWALRLPN